MIPASYLFKNAYYEAWERPAPVFAPLPSKKGGGLLRPLINAVRAVGQYRRAPMPTFHHT